MTDANLMDADCIHGVVWWECQECEVCADCLTFHHDVSYHDDEDG